MAMRLWIISIGILALPSLLWAGGWTEKQGDTYLKLSQSWLQADGYYDPDGNRIPIRTLGTYTTSLFGRYGITDKWTVQAYVPLFVRNTLNAVEGRQSGDILTEGAAKNGFGDMDLSVQYGLFQKKGVALSLMATLGLPTGSTNDPNGLFTGDGEFNQMLQFDAGYGYFFRNRHTVYANVYGAFNHRTKGFSEEVRFGGELGFMLWKRLFLAVKVNGIKSLKNNDATQAGGIGLFANNVEYLLYGPEVAYFIKERFGFSYQYTTATAVVNAVASPVHHVGFSIKLSRKGPTNNTTTTPSNEEQQQGL